MPFVVRRRNSFRKELLIIILLSVLAGLIGGGLIGITTGHSTTAQDSPGRTG